MENQINLEKLSVTEIESLLWKCEQRVKGEQHNIVILQNQREKLIKEQQQKALEEKSDKVIDAKRIDKSKLPEAPKNQPRPAGAEVEQPRA